MTRVYFKKIQYCFVDIDMDNNEEAKSLIEEFIDSVPKFTMLDLSNGNLNEEEKDEDNERVFNKLKSVYLASGEEEEMPEFDVD